MGSGCVLDGELGGGRQEALDIASVGAGDHFEAFDAVIDVEAALEMRSHLARLGYVVEAGGVRGTGEEEGKEREKEDDIG